MYERSQVWLEAGPKHYRGFGGLGAVYPGSTCYDPSHDNGQIHCAAASDVILSAFNPFTSGQTTTCSDQETSCVQSAPAGGAAPVDPASVFASSVPWIVVGIVALFALPALLGRH